MQGHISPFLSTWCPRHVYKMSFPDARMTWGIPLWNRRDWWFWMALPKNSKRVLSGIVVAESSFSEVDFTSTSSVEFCHFLGDLWSKHIPYLQEIWTHMAKCHMYKRWLADQVNESHQANLWAFVLGAPSHQTKHSITDCILDWSCMFIILTFLLLLGMHNLIPRYPSSISHVCGYCSLIRVQFHFLTTKGMKKEWR